MISKNLQEKIKAQAFRCPSVHNVQPWLLQVEDESLTVYDDLRRVLHIGDPQLHDHEVSMGAFIEGLDLILKTEGLQISKITDLNSREVIFQGKKIRARFKIEVANGGTIDPLSLQIPERKSYRGVFQKNTPADRSTLASLMTGEISAVVHRPEELKTWSKLYDECAVRGNANRAYQEELYSWLRLTEKHPQYQKDGLNRQALSLSSLEGSVANVLMKPGVYKKMNQLGMAQALVSEAPQIQSSTGLVFIFKKDGASAFENGRAFYRLWLELSQNGFNACPLSSLVDDAETRKVIESTFPGRQPLNVLRVGRAPKNKIYTSPRLDKAETMVSGVQNEN